MKEVDEEEIQRAVQKQEEMYMNVQEQIATLRQILESTRITLMQLTEEEQKKHKKNTTES